MKKIQLTKKAPESLQIRIGEFVELFEQGKEYAIEDTGVYRSLLNRSYFEEAKGKPKKSEPAKDAEAKPKPDFAKSE